MQKKFFWPYMANDFYQTVTCCVTCDHNRKTLKLKRHLQMFPLPPSPKFIAMDILCSLPQEKNGNLFVIVMTDQYLKKTGAIRISTTWATHVTNVFLDYWIVSYGIPHHLLTQNVPAARDCSSRYTLRAPETEMADKNCVPSSEK